MHRATSVSLRVRKHWDGLVPGSRLVGVFDRACNLLSPDGNVTALVLPEVGNGPLNIVIGADEGVFGPLRLDQRIAVADAVLVLGSLRIALDGAESWEPRPEWHSLRQQFPRSTHASHLLRVVLEQASDRGLLALLPGAGDSRPVPEPFRAAIVKPAERGAHELRAGLVGSVDALRRAARLLAGLGEGLTPAGDDFLAGAMIGIWLTRSEPEHTCQILLEASAPHTTSLSASLLEAAADGECNESWHELLEALVGQDSPGIDRAVQRVLASGKTSGADTLAGFLWTSLENV